MLIRLKGRTSGIILTGRLGNFHMGSQDMRDGLAIRKGLQASDAGSIDFPILNIKASRIKSITCKKNAGLRIVKRETARFMTGNGNRLDDATAKIIVGNRVGPIGDAKESHHRGLGRPDYGGVRAPGELRIRRAMITMRVTVGHDQHDLGSLGSSVMFHQKIFHGCRQRKRGGRCRRPGINQKRLLRAKDQINERRFKVHAFVLPQNRQIFIVSMDLERRIIILIAVGSPSEPLHI